jgi:hypothetical protein
MKNSKFVLVPRIALLLAIGLLIRPTPSPAVSGDEHWDPQFGLTGTSFNTQALTVNNGVLIAGGYSGSSTNSTLMIWDGCQWSPLGLFGNSSTAYIYDVAYAGSFLYVAGQFTSVNGTAANGLARWDGNAWSSVGFNGVAFGLTVSGSSLFVGGAFAMSDSSGVVMTNIGLWDGSAWHALGGGLGISNSGYVRSLVFNGGLLCAGGSFTNSASQAVTNLAAWDGSTWSAVGGGVNGIVYGLAVSAGNLYAGGGFTQAGSTPANYVAQWNGATWSALSNGLGNWVYSVAVFSNQLCVAGSFTSAGGITASNFAVWNGVSWSAAGSGLSASGLRVISNGTNVYAGGTFGMAGGVYANGAASWDGNKWSALGAAGRTNGLLASAFALANDGANLYAGGLFTYTSPTNTPYVARFDGTNWHPMGSGMSPLGGLTTVRALACSSNNVYAGGEFSFAGGVYSPNCARWDGANWNAMGTGLGSVVAAILVQTNGIYVAGAQTNGLLYNSPFFDVWTGSNWQGVGIGVGQFGSLDTYFNDSNIGMDALAAVGTNIFLGGHFLLEEYSNFPSGYMDCSNILRFDGVNGWTMGTGLNSNVVAMTTWGTNLYVGGLFTNASGVAASHIAMWNGTSWSALGSGVVGTGTVSSLASLGNYVYAGGSFTNMGGVAASHIAKWDGTNWYALGSGTSGISGSVLSLMPFGSSLYIGGAFQSAGGEASYNIGRWNDQINFYTVQILNPAWLGNGRMQMELLGVAGQTNIIQATANFQSWAPVLTNTNGFYEFTDTSASNYPYRFYRAKLGP